MAFCMRKFSLSRHKLGSALPTLYFFLVPLFCSVFLISLFFDFIPTAFGAYADQRFFQVGLMVVVIAASLGWKGEGGEYPRLIASAWPALLVAISFVLLALPFASNRFNWVEPGLFAFFFLAFAILGWRIQEEGASQLAVRLLVVVSSVACFFYATMTITVYLFAITDGFADLTDIIPWGFVNMRYWGHMATWLLPILPLALLVGPLAQNRKWRWSVSFAAGVWWWMVFMTTSRGTMVSLGLAFALAFIVFGRALLPWARIYCTFIVFGGAAWALLSFVIPSIVFETATIRSIHSGSSGRLSLWWEAWSMSLADFPWGLGPQSWITHELISNQDQLPIRFGHPHSIYLMWAAEYGWMLVVALLILLVHVTRRLVVKASQLGGHPSDIQTSLVAFSVSVIAGASHAGLSAVFIVPASMLVGLCILSIFWALIATDKPLEPLLSTAKVRLVSARMLSSLLLVVVLVVGGGWIKQVWEYHQAMENDLITYEQRPNAAYFPRFWFHGNFPREEHRSGPPLADQ